MFFLSYYVFYRYDTKLIFIFSYLCGSIGKVLMATVKGDVHDIGKNIVAVVLGCNNYKVYDIGVMCSCEKILEKAKEYNVDVIGLSGLITPSLDEMVTVAKELAKAGFKQPLLIGGATTSKMHTAVKIAPNFFNETHPVIHVLDASRSVTVVSSLLNANKTDFVDDLQEEYDEMREDYYAGLEDRNFLTFEQAKKEHKKIDFDAVPPAPVPTKTGITVIDSVKLADVVPYMDWVRVIFFYFKLICVVYHFLFASLIHIFVLLFLLTDNVESILPNLGVAWSLS